MTPERLRQVEELFHAARETTPQERGKLLAAADPDVRREVESLLAERAGALLDRPLPAATLETVTRLATGTQLGPYAVEGALGAGGMGTVYRARDTRLGRPVAIKISSTRFSDRFSREARAIAALNHPHICTLYDVGPNYLVMELVEGETVAAALKKGALEIKRVLAYGAQIAGALAAAHAKGITHRDLKPGNIMLTKSGAKVLDFGLAKIASATEEPLTESRVVMGTPGYMAPEQMEGKECDARTDIYALGLVLHEMASGKRAGRDRPPALDEMPPQFAHIVQRCLEEDPHARWQAASDVQAELEWAASVPTAAPGPSGSPGSRAKWAAVLLCAAALAVAVVALAIGTPWRSAPALNPVRFEIPLPNEARNPGNFSVAPDGRSFAFTAIGPSGGPRYPWLHAVGSPETRSFPDIQGAVFPFWSPDSRAFAVFTPNKLIRIDIAGGPPETVCDCTGTNGSWNQDGVILFGDPEGRLLQVPAGGGVPLAVSKAGMSFPYFLPDGKHFLYLGGPGRDHIGVARFDGKQAAPVRELTTAPFAAVYAPPAGSGPGYLLFYRDETLLAQPFDPRRLETKGDPLPLAQHLQSIGSGNRAFFTASSNNVLVYRVSGAVPDTQLTWYDRRGTVVDTVGQPESHLTLSLSPDGRRLAYVRQESRTNLDSNLWLLEVAHGNQTRITSGTGSVNGAVWSPDGSDLVYSVNRESRDVVYRKHVSGGEAEELVKLERAVPNSWSPDSHWLLYQTYTTTTSTDLWLLSLAGDRKPVSYLTTDYPEGFGRFSPDGHWVLYQSGESGHNEVYVREFSGVPSASRGATRRLQVSQGVGTQPPNPHWGADGKEVFYVGANRNVMAVDFTAAGALRAGKPRVLFQLPLGAEAWDVTRDGKRFLVAVPVAPSAPPPFTVVLNWQSLLKK